MIVRCWRWVERVAHVGRGHNDGVNPVGGGLLPRPRGHLNGVRRAHRAAHTATAGTIAKIACVVIGSGAIGGGAAIGGHIASGGSLRDFMGPGPSGLAAYPAPPVSEIAGTREVIPVPEPSSLLLFAAGIAGLLVLRNKLR